MPLSVGLYQCSHPSSCPFLDLTCIVSLISSTKTGLAVQNTLMSPTLQLLCSSFFPDLIALLSNTDYSSHQYSAWWRASRERVPAFTLLSEIEPATSSIVNNLVSLVYPLRYTVKRSIFRGSQKLKNLKKLLFSSPTTEVLHGIIE